MIVGVILASVVRASRAYLRSWAQTSERRNDVRAFSQADHAGHRRRPPVPQHQEGDQDEIDQVEQHAGAKAGGA